MTDATPPCHARPSRAALAASLALCAAAALVFACLARESSHFIGDDLVAFRDARAIPLPQLLWRPLDLHFLPLNRLAGALLFRAAPWNFDLALTVLLGFQGLGVWLLYRTLQRLGPSPLHPPLVLWYGTNFYLGILFTWWAAGIARLPCIVFSLGAVSAYLEFRKNGAWRQLGVVVACVVAASAFFSKGLLVPGVLAALEIVHAWDTPRRRLARNLAVVAAVACVAIALRGIGEAVVAPWALPPVQWREQAAALVAAGAQLQLAIFGATPMQLPPGVAWFTGSLLLVGVAASSWRDWRNGITWLVLAVVLAVNFLVISLSPRILRWGVLIVTNERYFYEVFHLVALFGAIVLQRSWRGRPVGRPVVIAAWLVALACAVASQHSVRVVLATPRYADTLRTRAYLENLKADLAELRATRSGPLAFRAGLVPREVVGFAAESVRPLSIFLPLFDRDVVVSRRGDCLHQVTAEGHIRSPGPACGR